MKEEVALRWLKKAENDLKAVKHLLTFKAAPAPTPLQQLHQAKSMQSSGGVFRRSDAACHEQNAKHRRAIEKTKSYKWVKLVGRGKDD